MKTPREKLTGAQRKALDWLEQHNGDGMFDQNGVLLAAGESGPFMRSTWNGLRKAGWVEFYRLVVGKGLPWRVRIKP